MATIGVLALPGCRAGGNKNVSEVNDTLRHENLDLTAQVQRLKGEKAELLVKLTESERVRRDALPPDVLDAVPRCTGIEIASLGTGFDPPSSGLGSGTGTAAPATGVTVYVKAHDGRDRFVPMVGTLKVSVLVLPATLNAEQVAEHAGQKAAEQATRNAAARDKPQSWPADADKEKDKDVIARGHAELGPAPLRDAYRDAPILGTAYAVPVKLGREVSDRRSKLVVRVEFLDALTGQVHKSELLK